MKFIFTMRLKNILLIMGVLFIITSCTTTEKFSVYAPAGTRIYTPNSPDTPINGGINSEKIKVTVPSDMYCGYMLAQPAGSDLLIPIGIDYKTNKHTGTKAAIYTGYGLLSVGVGGALIGTMMMLLSASYESAEDIQLLSACIAGVGGATAGLGAAIGTPAHNRLRQTAYDYNFSYEKKQKLAIPMLSSTLLNPNPPKNGDKKAAEQKAPAFSRKKATSGKDVVSSASSGSKVKKSRSDYGKKIEGEYKGTGTLLYGNEVNEKYSEIFVVMERIDKTHVSVRIIESNEDYFDTPLVYEIKANKNGGYTLNLENLPEAVIQVTNRGKLTFEHKKVNIDNQIYTLDISADRN